MLLYWNVDFELLGLLIILLSFLTMESLRGNIKEAKHIAASLLLQVDDDKSRHKRLCLSEALRTHTASWHLTFMSSPGQLCSVGFLQVWVLPLGWHGNEHVLLGGGGAKAVLSLMDLLGPQAPSKWRSKSSGRVDQLSTAKGIPHDSSPPTFLQKEPSQ